MFFKLLSTIKVNLVATIIQSAYLCVIFHVNNNNKNKFIVPEAEYYSTKNYYFSRFNLISTSW